MIGSDDLELDLEQGAAAPVWAVFGDLMAGVLGAFALMLVCAIGMQMDLTERLSSETQQRVQQAQRLQTLEQALADPLGRSVDRRARHRQ